MTTLVLKANPALGGLGFMLFDQDGNLLPGQVSVQTAMGPGDDGQIEAFVTVTFQLNGKTVKAE